MPGGIDHRNAGGPGGGEELPRRFQRPPRMLAAGARITPVDFAHRAVTALIDFVVEIDRQHRGTGSDPNFTTIGFIDLDDLLIDDVLPAMIFKIAHRSRLLRARSGHIEPLLQACEEIKDLTLRSALQGASRRMAASPCRASILRDARKSALLRMRSEYCRTSENQHPLPAGRERAQ